MCVNHCLDVNKHDKLDHLHINRLYFFTRLRQNHSI